MARTNESQSNLAVTSEIPKSKGLSETASMEWDRIVGEVKAAGVQLSPMHRAPLTLAATIAADIRQGWERIKEDGAYIMTKAGLQAHPASKRIDALRRDYVRVLALLGLRASVSSGTADKETLDDVLKG